MKRIDRKAINIKALKTTTKKTKTKQTNKIGKWQFVCVILCHVHVLCDCVLSVYTFYFMFFITTKFYLCVALTRVTCRNAVHLFRVMALD